MTDAPVITPLAPFNAEAFAKLGADGQAALEANYVRSGRTPAEIAAWKGTPASNVPVTPQTEAEAMRIRLGMTPEAWAEHQARQGITNTGVKPDIFSKPELNAPPNAADYKLPIGMIPEGKDIKEALAEHAAIGEAFRAANVPVYAAGAIFEALKDSAAEVARITDPLAKSLHNQQQKVVLDRIWRDGADAAIKLAARVTSKFPPAMRDAWVKSGALDNARTVALLARVGEIDRDREKAKTKT